MESRRAGSSPSLPAWGSLLATLFFPPVVGASEAAGQAVVLATSSIKETCLLGGAAKHDVSISRLAGAFAAQRERGLATVAVDGGNFLLEPNSGLQSEFPSTFSSADFMCEIMEQVGYDALTPGLNELSIGRSTFMELVNRHPSLRFVSANVRDKHGKLVFPAYLLIKKGDVTFGITGVTDSLFYAYRVRKGQAREDFHVDNPGPALNKVLKRLRRQCDVTVVLLHQSKTDALALIPKTPGIDIAVQSLNPGASLPDQKLAVSGSNTWVLFPATHQGFYSRAVLQLAGRRNATVERVLVDRTDPEEPRTAALMKDWITLQRFEGQYFGGLQNAVREGPEWLRGGIPWFVASWSESPDSSVVFLEGWNEKDLRLVWQGPLKWETRPLYARLLEPPAVNPLLLKTESESRFVTIGGQEEAAISDVLDFLAFTQASIEERDSLLDLWHQPETFVRAHAPPTAAFGLHRLSSLLKEQSAERDAGNPPYWRRRSVVYLNGTPDPQGGMKDVSIVENNAWPGEADFFKQLEIERDPNEGSRILVAIARDRREERFEAALDALKARWGNGSRPPHELVPEDAETWEGTHLPAQARKTLNSKTLSQITSVWKKADPDFAWDDFICTPSDTLLDISRLLKDPESTVLRKAKTADGGALFLGWSTVEHPRFENGTWGYLEVPTVWLSEPQRSLLLRFQGALSPQINAPDVRQALEAVRLGR